MKLYRMKEDALAWLKSNLESLYMNYYLEDNNDWIAREYGENPFEFFMEVSDFELTSLDSDLEKSEIDLNNCKILYKNLMFISDTQASDGRLWAGLAHSTFYDYMRRRWGYGYNKVPREATREADEIKTRFFYKLSGRGDFYRNTLSKYWWVGKRTYDNSNIFNPFEMLDGLGAYDFSTKISDIFYSWTMTDNAIVAHGILYGIGICNKKGARVQVRMHIRPLMRKLHDINAECRLEDMQESEITEMTVKIIEDLLNQEELKPAREYMVHPKKQAVKQLDFEGLGFKFRVPIYNREGTDVLLRTAVIPTDDIVHNIEIVAMKLTVEANITYDSFQDDIEPSAIEVGDSRTTVNAVFHSVEDYGDVEYDLCISVNDLTTNQHLKIYYVFHTGSTIATFVEVEISTLTKKSDEEEETADDVVEKDDEGNVLNNGVEDESTEKDWEDALQRATKLLWIANKQLEEASIKLLSQESQISILESKLDKIVEIEELQKIISDRDEEIQVLKRKKEDALARVSSLENQVERVVKERDRDKIIILDLKRMYERTKAEMSLLESRLSQPVSQMERHLNNIVDYMETTANIAGISLENIYVRTTIRDGKRHVNVCGEIRFAKGIKSLRSSCDIKASLYDANGKIEIEGHSHVFGSFKGFDTFDIGWNGGTDESWLTKTKIRIFVV